MSARHCLAVLATALAALLAPAPATAQSAVDGDAPMGSQIRLHEGVAEDQPRVEVSLEASVAGMDVSGHQREVDWGHWWRQGKRFVYVKATEGTGFRNPYYRGQYDGSRGVGMIRGAYHFALPDRSSGAAQANYFVDNGGGWRGDGHTLPGALDIEYNPYGQSCYGLSQDAMSRWIKDFSDTYHRRTGRWPTVYTSTSWWATCTGNRLNLSGTNPLWVARYASSVGALPHAWPFYTFWQYTSKPLDQNTFNGAYHRLQVLARGH
ncbi:lysozyme [Crossiella sp. CA-258035]|uniref:lysozyme n=1 Tax=Crossiella sp. CA-258035 TaxID=2981138 RepID=UPI0024BCDDEB|nr:lysozyme [Crossiella sp. CA-258035]WHT22458.1 lysozyme [Crossiella sp. CA-258035]